MKSGEGHSHAIGITHRVTLGANYRHNTLSGTQISGFSQEDRFGVYLQEEWHVLQTLTLTAGLRMDTHTEIDPTYSPRVALIYAPHPNHTVRLSGSVAYRPPHYLKTTRMCARQPRSSDFPSQMWGRDRTT